MDLTDRIDEHLSESKSVFNKLSKAPREMEQMYNKLAEIRRNLEALDNEVGGTSMMKDINKDHSKLMPTLNFFIDTVKSALHEYRGMMK